MPDIEHIVIHRKSPAASRLIVGALLTLVVLVGILVVTTGGGIFRTGIAEAARCGADAISGVDGSAARPIIPEVLSAPEDYVDRCVVISGRVVTRNDHNVILDDIALRPIAVVLKESALIPFKVNDRILVAGTVRIEKGNPVFHAEQSKVDVFLGGGCC